MENSIKSTQCIPYQYIASGITRYGFYCPFTKKVSLSLGSTLVASKFLYPYINGRKMPDLTYSSWSNDTGVMVSFLKQDNSAMQLTSTGLLTLVGDGITPAIAKAFKNQMVTWNFVTKNPIPINGQIKVTFQVVPSISINTMSICKLKANLSANDRTHSCSMSSTSSSITFSFSTSDPTVSNFPTGNYSLFQYGITQSGVDSNLIKYTLETQTSTSIPIDSTSDFQGKMYFNNLATVPSILVSSITFNSTSVGFRGNVIFSFTI